jgi:Ca-activated chloride channel family protein
MPETALTRSVPLLAIFLVQFLTFGFAEASLAEGLGPRIRPGEMRAGGLLIRQPDGLHAAPSLETDVDVQITGMIGRMRVSQRFHNPTSGWVEAVYVFPLPERAAVDGLRMKIGERIIEGQVQERAKARATYARAKGEGRKASLVEQERPNLFTTSVANLGPGEEIEVVLTYQEEIRYDTGRFLLRFPMVVGPRYIPGATSIDGFTGTGWAANTVQVPDAERITPPIADSASDSEGGRKQPVSIRVRIEAGFRLVEVESASHPVRVRARRGDIYEIELSDGPVPANADFVLSWRPVVGKAPGAALFYEQQDGEHYALLMVLPPSIENTPQARLSKETIFVIDTSGSMGGDSIRQARSALVHALGRLDPGDAFNVIRFDSSFERLYPDARAADSTAISEAVAWVRRLDARGGTEMLPALEAALAQGSEIRAVRQVIFMTDGAVGNESALFRAIERDLGRSRLYTVGIGSAPNSHFMSKAAEFGRGTFTYIASPEEIEIRMGELFAKLDSPVLHDLTIGWDAAGVEVWPKRLPDVYLGEPVVIAARLPASVGEVALSGRRGHEDFRVELDVRGGSKHVGVGRLWARRKIAALMNSLQDGADVEGVSSEVVQLGIAHHLVTRWTSLVAVDVTPTAPVDVVPEKRAVPSLLPRGWSLRRLFGFEKNENRSGTVPDPSGISPSGSGLKQASLAVVRPQVLAFAPPGRLPMGATPATLFLSIGTTMLGASGLLWGSFLIRGLRGRRRRG